jgi:hypothetical protein
MDKKIKNRFVFSNYKKTMNETDFNIMIKKEWLFQDKQNDEIKIRDFLKCVKFITWVIQNLVTKSFVVILLIDQTSNNESSFLIIDRKE